MLRHFFPINTKRSSLLRSVSCFVSNPVILNLSRASFSTVHSANYIPLTGSGSVAKSSFLLTCDSTIQHFNRQLTTTHIVLRKMGNAEATGLVDTTSIARPNKVKLTREEWKAKLTPEQFDVCRNHGTERAWTGDLLEEKDKGTFICACCGTELFKSDTKYDSGSGWPSFFDVLKDKDVQELPAVDTRVDSTAGMTRTEVLCGKCDAHLGHVFNDGPQPTGLRYCINSVCLKFKSEKKSEL